MEKLLQKTFIRSDVIFATLFLHDEEEKGFVSAATTLEKYDQDAAYKVGDGSMTARVIESKKPLIINDTTDEKEQGEKRCIYMGKLSPEEKAKGNPRSYIGVPVFKTATKEEVIGVLCLFAEGKGKFNEEYAALLHIFALIISKSLICEDGRWKYSKNSVEESMEVDTLLKSVSVLVDYRKEKEREEKINREAKENIHIYLAREILKNLIGLVNAFDGNFRVYKNGRLKTIATICAQQFSVKA